MKRYGTIALAVLVGAAIIGLIWLLRADSRQTAPPSQAPSRPERAPRTAIPKDRQAPPRPVVEAKIETDDERDQMTNSPKRYIRSDGVEVRDYRSGDREVDLTRAIPRPAKLARLASETVLKLHNAVRPIVDKCSEGLDRGEFGDKPRVRVDAIVAVEGETLRIDRASVHLDDMPPDAKSALANCIEEPALQLSVLAEGEEDLSNYTLSLPYTVR